MPKGRGTAKKKGKLASVRVKAKTPHIKCGAKRRRRKKEEKDLFSLTVIRIAFDRPFCC